MMIVTNRNELDDDGYRITALAMQAAGVMPLDAARTLTACVEQVKLWMRHGNNRENGND